MRCLGGSFLVIVWGTVHVVSRLFERFVVCLVIAILVVSCLTVVNLRSVVRGWRNCNVGDPRLYGLREKWGSRYIKYEEFDDIRL